MKALTLTQPWASLVAVGVKHIETRSWSTRYRGPIAIHAAKGFPADARDFTYTKMVRESLSPHYLDTGPLPSPLDKRLPLGCIVATAYLADVMPMERFTYVPGTKLWVSNSWPAGFEITDGEKEYAFGNYEPGRYGWMLKDVRPVSPPIPAKGALGLWEWEPAA